MTIKKIFASIRLMEILRELCRSERTDWYVENATKHLLSICVCHECHVVHVCQVCHLSGGCHSVTTVKLYVIYNELDGWIWHKWKWESFLCIVTDLKGVSYLQIFLRLSTIHRHLCFLQSVSKKSFTYRIFWQFFYVFMFYMPLLTTQHTLEHY